MKKLKSLLIYKILNEIKNSSLGIIKYVYFCVYKIILVVKEHYCDRKLGIETAELFVFKDKFSLYKDSVIYQATPYDRLEKVVDYLKLTSDDIFIDLGCGKGRVIFFVARQKLKKVVGVEINEELIDTARENYRHLKINNTAVEIIHGDAAKFTAEEGTIFFMFNPFGYRTLRDVINNIKNSLVGSPRKIRILYLNPIYAGLLDSQDWLVPEGEIDDTNIFVWHNK